MYGQYITQGNPMEDVKLAYIAGIVDGEGSIMKELNGIASPATTERKGIPGRWPSVRVEATV